MVSKVELTPTELKDFLSASIEGIYTKKEQNGDFFECSSNVKIVANTNSEGKPEISEIYIDDENILAPENSDKKYVCAIDGYSAWKNKLKSSEDMGEIKMVEALQKKLKKEAEEPTYKEDYPIFKVICDGVEYN